MTGLAALIIILLVTIWAVDQNTPVLGGWMGGLIIGIVLGLLAVMPLFTSMGNPDKSRESRRPEAFARVTPQNEQAWQLCEVVQELVTCHSWVDRTIDPQRRIPVLLWTAVQRALEVADRQDAVSRARSHPSLDDLAQDVAAKAERERAALVSVLDNLHAIHDAARQVDRTRDERVQQLQAAQDKQLEERQLRSKLLGTSTSVGSAFSENRADVAAGLAAEAETVAALLADTDRLLHA